MNSQLNKLMAYLHRQEIIKLEFKVLYAKQLDVADTFFNDKTLITKCISLWKNLYYEGLAFLSPQAINLIDRTIKELGDRIWEIDNNLPFPVLSPPLWPYGPYVLTRNMINL